MGEGPANGSFDGAATTCTGASAEELTIVTVGIRKHYDYIRRQIRIIDSLNAGQPYRLIVVDNAQIKTPELTIDDPRCIVLAGVDPMPLPEQGRGSYHHAAALN